jgi:uncharacterized protein YabN with tetrapyrrole methylase and pyrophosphatase domain
MSEKTEPVGESVFARALAVQRNASVKGLDWDDARDVLKKMREEVDEADAAIRSGSEESFEDEVGDLLFSAVNVARMLGVDPEGALRCAVDKFEQRFRRVLALARKKGRRVEEMSIDELDVLWEEAKRDEATGSK